jgi:hypothetical protein
MIGDMPGAVCHYRLGASNELDDVSERVGGRVNIRRGSTGCSFKLDRLLQSWRGP